jgi:hypothetical protein
MLFPSPRSAEQRADQVWSWQRSDEEFFSSGACHILAKAFVERFFDRGFRALLILPRPGLCGRHVVASSADFVFDANGLAGRARFLREYVRHFRSLQPAWCAALVDVSGWLDDPARIERLGHRPPGKFLGDPTARAGCFIDVLIEREGVGAPGAGAAVAPRKTWS